METCLWRPANHPFTPASILFRPTTHDVWILAALITYAFTLYWKSTEYSVLLVCSTTNSDVSSLLLAGGWDIAVVRDSHSLPFKTFRKTLFFPSSVSFRCPCSYTLDIKGVFVHTFCGQQTAAQLCEAASRLPLVGRLDHFLPCVPIDSSSHSS